MTTTTSTIDMSKITHVIMDIEGTVAPIEFVHQKMFPYVRNNVQTYLESTWDTPQTQSDIGLLIQQSKTDQAQEQQVEKVTFISGDLETTPKADLLPQIVANVISQMDIDRKIGALKTLQGHMWANAFGSGELVAELYDDVYEALSVWTREKMTLCIYSSGSIGAQKLLFSHTKKGDLTPLFAGFYDTGVGFKREKQSYVNILEALNMVNDPQKCLFLTDIYEESVAADEAGMKTVIMLRPGNYPLPEGAERFKQAESFLALDSPQ